LARSENRQAALRRALHLLAAGDRSRADLRRRLAAVAEPEAVEAALDRLAAWGLLDDAAFADRLAERTLARGGASARQVAQRLNAHGVAAGTQAAALSRVRAAEAESARRLAGRLDDAMRHRPPAARARRLAAALLRRGYPPSLVRSVVEAQVPEAADGGWLESLDDLDDGGDADAPRTR
jgi:regulatory protein